LRALETGPDQVRCAVEVHGPVGSYQGINLPGADVGLPAVGGEDLAWVDFAVQEGVDLLAVSFVRRPDDLEPVRERLEALGSDIPLIAKIEKSEASERAEQIAASVPGVMVARGDLGIELPIEQVPQVQRRLLQLAGQHAVTTITATQMLASMSPRHVRPGRRSPMSLRRSCRARTP
jgi:pyruvate kinase